MGLYALVLFLTLIACNDAVNRITCRSDPETNDKDQVVSDGDRFVLTCDGYGTQHDHIKYCGWAHFYPLNDHPDIDVPDIECQYESNSHSECPSDSRISGTVDQQTCSITVSNSNPNDTGTWTATVLQPDNSGNLG